MTDVLSPPAAAPSSSAPHTSSKREESSESISSLSSSTAKAIPRERIPSYAQNRMSQYSQQSQHSHRTSRSRPHSSIYPAFPSSLPYALVRDFAYPVYHPMHYGAEPELSGESTPVSEWNPARRQSDPMEQWNSAPAGHSGGWNPGPWGGDGVMYGDPEHDEGHGSGENLPSTSFGSEGAALEAGIEEELAMRRSGRHRKSKSYASPADFERGRRRDSDGVRSFHGSHTDPAGRERLRASRGYSGVGSGNYDASNANGGARRDSPFSTVLHNRSFHHGRQDMDLSHDSLDPDSVIPLDTEPHADTPSMRDSLGPEDEDLFAGPSLALYSFEPENSNELRLIEGQEILVSYRNGQGWLVASDPKTGEQGLVPEAYVRLIADIPGYDPETGQFVDLDGEGGEGEEEEEAEEEDGDGIEGKDEEDAVEEHARDSSSTAENGPGAHHASSSADG